MKRVTGIGGIFFKAKDAPALQAWYKRHLGIDVQAWGGAAFDWTDSDGKPTGGTTAWSIHPADGNQFAPGSASFMVNYRVEDVHALVAALKSEGCNVLDKIDDSEYGKFDACMSSWGVGRNRSVVSTSGDGCGGQDEPSILHRRDTGAPSVACDFRNTACAARRVGRTTLLPPSAEVSWNDHRTTRVANGAGATSDICRT